MEARTRLARLIATLAAAIAALALAASAAWAGSEGPQWLDSDQYEIEWFTTATSTTQSGAQTDYNNAFGMKYELYGSGEHPITYGRSKKFEFDLPPGLTGNPTVIPTCSREVFFRFVDAEGCPMSTRIGTVTVYAVGVGQASMVDRPIFNLKPGPNEPALFGLKLNPTLYAFIEIDVSPDGDLTAVIDENAITSPVYFSDATMWGVPQEHGVPGEPVAFMRNPTECEREFTTVMRGESYEDRHDSISFTESARVGCDEVPFDPSMSVTPTSREAGGPTGLDVELQLPQSDDPSDLATAHVKDVTMRLPEGLIANASSAAGLGSCSPQQFGYHQETPITCPLDSKIGSVEIETPILDEPLTGPVYVAKQNDNPFNSLMALYMAPSAKGVTIKLAGKVDLDPNTGRLTTTFLNNPQQPFSRLRVKLKDGPRAPLALPDKCGTYTVSAELTSWARPDSPVSLSDGFAVDQGCGRDRQFTPGFSGGTTNPTAGGYSPLTLRITRPDGQQNISHFEVTLPEGLLANLSGIPLCSDAAAAAAACPEASKVGHTTVGVGAGPSPVFAPEPGKAPTALYLGGPYKGAPYSIIAQVPAQAGPFDLGTVVVRNALHVDRVTTRVTAKADPLPQILQGIPIRYRDVRVDVDRNRFTVNPTDCETQELRASIESIAGQAVGTTHPFGVTGCRNLGFKPQLSLRLKGGTKRNKFPALTAVLKARPGDANIDRAQVALPRSEFLEQAHIRTICTRVQWAADQCPKAAIYGYAKAVTPLLDEPLEGPVYLRASDNPLPDLVADLRGPIRVELAGRIDSIRGGIRTTFDFVPDAPVTSFELRMQGGKKGLLVNSRDICRGTYRATVRMNGQNGRVHDFRPQLVNPACGKKKARKAAAAKRRG